MKIQTIHIWVLVFICAAVFNPSTAQASFQKPKSCTDLTPQQLLSQADLAGYGKVVDASCKCNELGPLDYGCTAKVTFSELNKGNPPSLTVTYRERLPVDAPYEEQCLWYKKEMEERIGTARMFYFQQTEAGFIELSDQVCVY